jgi:MYXO-CTERM domain-containing protein
MAEGNFTRIYRANFDGSYPFLIYSSEVSIGQTIEATTGDQRGNTCSFGLPFGGGSGGLVALGLGLVVALRRRGPSAPR